MKKSILYIILFLAAVDCGAQTIAPLQENTTAVKIIYFDASNQSIRLPLLASLENLCKKDPKNLKFEKIETEATYVSNSNYLIAPPKDIRRDKLPNNSTKNKTKEEVSVIESAGSVLFQYPKTFYPLLDELYADIIDTENWTTFVPGSDLKKAKIVDYESITGENLEVLSVGNKPISDFWGVTIAIHYYISVNGKQVRVTEIGKPLGGLSRLNIALKQRLKEIKEPPLLLVLGSKSPFIAKKIWQSPEAFMEWVKDIGANSIAVDKTEFSDWLEYKQVLSARGSKLICSNLKWTDSKSTSPFTPFAVENINGVKVGIVSFVQADTADKSGLYEIEDPIASAGQIVQNLHEKRLADIVVCISHLTSGDTAKLIADVPGIDVLLGSKVGEITTKRKTTVELSQWNKEKHYAPALKASRPTFSFGELTLNFAPDKSGRELASITEETPGPIGADMPNGPEFSEFFDKLVLSFLSPQAAVLPDPRKLWPDNPNYTEPDFFNLAAQILRKSVKTELAFLKINFMGSNIAGDVNESYISAWINDLGDPRYIVTMQLPGKTIRSLLRWIDFTPVPVNMQDYSKYNMDTKYIRETWLASAGIDKNGRISGLPIKDDELYTVAVGEDIVKKGIIPEFKSGINVRTINLDASDIAIDWLKQRKIQRDEEAKELYRKTLQKELGAKLEKLAQNQRVGEKFLEATFGEEKTKAEETVQRKYLDEIRLFSEGKTENKPIWRLNLKNLSIQFANTQVADNDQFAQARDARIHSINQTLVQGSIKLFSELYFNDFRWDSGISADYGKVTLKPAGGNVLKNETADQLVFETELRKKAFLFCKKKLGGSIGPFANFSYNTEFTKPQNMQAKKLFRLKYGLKFFEGRYLQSLFAGGVTDIDRSAQNTNTEYGYETGFVWSSPLPKTSVYLKTQANYRWFADSRLDTADDLKSELEIDSRISVPLIGDLNLSPFFNFYLFKGKVVKATGHNMLFGIALDYSFLWKPVF